MLLGLIFVALLMYVFLKIFVVSHMLSSFVCRLAWFFWNVLLKKSIDLRNKAIVLLNQSIALFINTIWLNKSTVLLCKPIALLSKSMALLRKALVVLRESIVLRGGIVPLPISQWFYMVNQ